jgi:hypothetical protein
MKRHTTPFISLPASLTGGGSGAARCALSPARRSTIGLAAARTLRGPLVSGPFVSPAWAMRGRPVVGRRAMGERARPVNGRRAMVNGRARTVDEARVAPAMPSGGAAPAESAPPRKAALIPARAAPGRIVPAVPPAAPDELRLFDWRAFGKRRRRRERADAQRCLGRKGELRDQPRRDGDGQGELAKHGSVLQGTRLWRRCLNAG